MYPRVYSTSELTVPNILLHAAPSILNVHSSGTDYAPPGNPELRIHGAVYGSFPLPQNTQAMKHESSPDVQLAVWTRGTSIFPL